jgi:hypothetical protein
MRRRIASGEWMTGARLPRMVTKGDHPANSESMKIPGFLTRIWMVTPPVLYADARSGGMVGLASSTRIPAW